MRLILALLMLMLMLPALPALAQDADQPARLAEANQLVSMVVDGEQLDRLIDAMQPTMLEGLKQEHGIMLTDAMQGKFRQVMREEFRRIMNESTGGMATAYAKVFSLEDLKQLIAFYSSDVGKRMLVATPELMKSFIPVLQANLRAEMPTLTAKLAAALNVPPPVAN